MGKDDTSVPPSGSKSISGVEIILTSLDFRSLSLLETKAMREYGKPLTSAGHVTSLLAAVTTAVFH